MTHRHQRLWRASKIAVGGRFRLSLIMVPKSQRIPSGNDKVAVVGRCKLSLIMVAITQRIPSGNDPPSPKAMAGKQNRCGRSQWIVAVDASYNTTDSLRQVKSLWAVAVDGGVVTGCCPKVLTQTLLPRHSLRRRRVHSVGIYVRYIRCEGIK